MTVDERDYFLHAFSLLTVRQRRSQGGAGGLQPPYWPAVHRVFYTIILSSMQITVLSPSKCDIKVAQSLLVVHPSSATAVRVSSYSRRNCCYTVSSYSRRNCRLQCVTVRTYVRTMVSFEHMLSLFGQWVIPGHILCRPYRHTTQECFFFVSHEPSTHRCRSYS